MSPASVQTNARSPSTKPTFGPTNHAEGPGVLAGIGGLASSDTRPADVAEETNKPHRPRIEGSGFGLGVPDSQSEP